MKEKQTKKQTNKKLFTSLHWKTMHDFLILYFLIDATQNLH